MFFVIYSACFITFGYAQFFYEISKNAGLVCDENFCSSECKKFIDEQKNSGENDIVLRLARNDRDRLSNQFISILDGDLTKYDEHFTKISDSLAKKRLEMLKLSNNHLFYNSFTIAVNFYKPSLGDNIPFIVYIVDQLDEPFYINTTLFIANSTAPKMFYFATIVRYFCEILYNYMSNKGEIAGYFHSSSSKYAGAAFATFKKALAHSISRWIIWKMGEHNLVQSGNEIIDKMSSFIAPFLRIYLNDNRQIDHDFVSQYIDVFAKNFKDAIQKFNLILTGNVVIKAGSTNIQEQTFQYLKKAFRTDTYQTEINQRNKFSPVIVIADGDGSVRVSISNGRIFIFISSLDPDKISKAIDILKKQAIAIDGFSENL